MAGICSNCITVLFVNDTLLFSFVIDIFCVIFGISKTPEKVVGSCPLNCDLIKSSLNTIWFDVQ